MWPGGAGNCLLRSAVPVLAQQTDNGRTTKFLRQRAARPRCNRRFDQHSVTSTAQRCRWNRPRNGDATIKRVVNSKSPVTDAACCEFEQKTRVISRWTASNTNTGCYPVVAMDRRRPRARSCQWCSQLLISLGARRSRICTQNARPACSGLSHSRDSHNPRLIKFGRSAQACCGDRCTATVLASLACSS